MSYQPTVPELRAAYRRAHLWSLGWSFARALSVPYIAQSLVNLVRAERAHRETRAGRLPAQQQLI